VRAVITYKHVVDLLFVLTINLLHPFQEDFDEFSDVEDLYSTLPMEKVEALEDMVSLAPSILIKVGLHAVNALFSFGYSDYYVKRKLTKLFVRLCFLINIVSL
jgi:hypothetical protein